MRRLLLQPPDTRPGLPHLPDSLLQDLERFLHRLPDRPARPRRSSRRPPDFLALRSLQDPLDPWSGAPPLTLEERPSLPFIRQEAME
jgi:hypothetical protein